MISERRHTLSCLPRRPPTTCGPTYTQYSSAHVFLQMKQRKPVRSLVKEADRSTTGLEATRVRTYVSVRFPLLQQSTCWYLSSRSFRFQADQDKSLPMLVAFRILIAKSASVLMNLVNGWLPQERLKILHTDSS